VATVLLALCACGEQPDPSYRYGHDLSNWSFVLSNVNMGIHPDDSVADDANNPFRRGAIGEQTKWDINDVANHAAGFYSWGTLLVRQPTGEHQYYTAGKLARLYLDREIENADLEPVRDMGIRAYQSLLDNFPSSVSYDTSGIYAFRLAPLAYQGILDLGGTVKGGWIEVTTPDGKTTVVQVPQEQAEEN
jgi:hypothetical protein